MGRHPARTIEIDSYAFEMWLGLDNEQDPMKNLRFQNQLLKIT